MQLRKREIKLLTNNICLILIWVLIYCIFKPDPIIAIGLLGCFLGAAVLKIPYGIAVILTLYFMIPSDSVSYMFVTSPVGKFPLYIILMLFFILINFFINYTVSMVIDKREFLVYIGLFGIIFLQIICLLLFSEKDILSNTVKFAFQTIGMLLLIKSSKITENTIYRISIFIILLSMVSIIEGMVEVFGGFNLYSIYGYGEILEWLDWMATSKTSIWRVKSTFANPLIYSSAMVLSLTCVEYIRSKNKNVIIPIVLISILAIGMLMGGSRSAIIILAIYLIYFVIDSKAKQKLFFVAGIIITCMLVLHFMDLSLIFERFTTSKTDGSLSHRLTAYGVFLKLFGQYFLIGCGLGNTYDVLQGQISEEFITNTFDNAFMDFSLGIGVIGVIVMIIVFKNIRDICKRKDHRLLKCAMLLAIALSFFLNITKYQSLWGILWVYIGLNIYGIQDFQEDRS